MQSSQRNKIKELQQIITRMPLQMCCVAVLPEFGVKWRDVSKAVRNARLPMTPASVARLLCRHIAKSMETEEIDEILARLRLKFVATQNRTWHVVTLSEAITTDPIMEIVETLPARIAQALKKGKGKNSRPEIQTVLVGELVYASVQLVSDSRQGAVLYAAAPPGHPVALLSTLGSVALIKAFVQGLGYKKYEDASLHGRDITSLLRIHDRAWTGGADHLDSVPEYAPIPTITHHGIDYTNKSYDDSYVDELLGPNPPLLTDLTIKTVKPFFDKDILDKTVTLKIQLRSENVAKTLKCWVGKGALSPTSDFFQIFHNIKSNRITYTPEDSD